MMQFWHKLGSISSPRLFRLTPDTLTESLSDVEFNCSSSTPVISDASESDSKKLLVVLLY
ncbi:hypothetical protein BpHYR1_036395 [Brachionus plicatilis]|uniref:Uncharacterized protein n=1 Tax=Brachionus plicatilis TaxID=10195 RepID=A0A3M7SNN9_BRAPC|nr:hypothetical protein BpHYR1_036395 [Brachionus plicatilis]